MTFHAKGLLVLVGFVAIAAGIAIELLLWSGVFGFGRAPR